MAGSEDLPSIERIQVEILIVLLFVAAVVVYVENRDTNRLKPPPPPPPTQPPVDDSLKVKYFPFYGQSLSVGRESVPIISSSQPYPSNVLGPAGGPRNEIFSLAPLKEVGYGKMGETPASGFANLYYGSFVGNKEKTVVISNTAGEGGQTVLALTDETRFGKLRRTFSQAKTQSASKFPEGKFVVPAVFWIQGEADRDTGFNLYVNQFIALHDKIQSLAKTTSGSGTHIISYQTAGNSGRDGMVQLAQMDLDRKGVLTIATPIHFLDFAGDQVHLTARSSLLLGAYMARAVGQMERSGVIQRVRPLRVSVVDPSRVRVHFEVPCKPLVVYDSRVKNLGFRVVDGSGGEVSIQSVKVVGDGDEVEIVANAPFNTTGCKVYHAIANGVYPNSSRSLGALRDSCNEKYDLGANGGVIELPHYVPHFMLVSQ